MTPSDKLENCEVCANIKAKYTCPRCEVRTCCLACSNIHKRELDCDGIRDRTKFIPLHQFTDLDLLSDYRLLEEVGRSVDQLQRDNSKKHTRFHNLPTHLYRLKQAASRSCVQLEFMPPNFSRHKQNTTFFNWKTSELFWRIEWIFSQAANTKWVTTRALETLRLSELLESILNPFSSEDMTSTTTTTTTGDVDEKKTFYNRVQFYRSSGLTGLKIFLKAEKVEKCDSRFYELDATLSLKENLANKTIIEFPLIYVALKDHADMYETIDTDEENDEEKRETSCYVKVNDWKNRRKEPKSKRQKESGGNNKEEKCKLPVNYFFNNAASSDSENDL